MVFSSTTFLFYFLPIFLLFYFAARKRATKNHILLAFSLLFYSWGEPVYILLMVISTIINWLLARRIGESVDVLERRRLLVICLVVDLSILGFFKYVPFLLESVHALTGIAIPYQHHLEHLPLPVGISFYTFQAMSYVIDVYRRKFPYEPSLLDFATYKAMFPQLIAGPIVRYADIKEQLHADRSTDRDLINGVFLFVIGLGFKVLLANTYAVDADHVFALDAARISTGLAWGGAVAYFFQIYFDFAGYSLMAIGLGRVLGFKFPMNFNRPYISRSITEFWRRWHITLSTWFRDYLYIPLGGNQSGNITTYRNLFIVFALCGLWHGAAWNFLIWGIYYGLFLIVERMLRGTKIVAPAFIFHLYALLVIIVGWVIFRSESLYQTLHYLGAMIGLNQAPYHLAREAITPMYGVFVAVGIYFSVLDIDYDNPPFAGRHRLRIGIYSLVFLVCVLYLTVGTHNPFIYFRF